jgi:hypothetical protein
MFLNQRYLHSVNILCRCAEGSVKGDGVERMLLGIKDVDVSRRDKDGVASGELEIVVLVARELNLESVVGVDRELDTNRSTQWSDTLDARIPARMTVSTTADLQVVRPHIDLGVGSGNRQEGSAVDLTANMDRLQRKDINLAQELGDERG